MERVKINFLKKDIYHEKLSNGLSVYMLPSKTKSYYISFSVKFGSGMLDFKDLKSGKRVNVKKGVAHFLEHQMFEDENISNFKKFASLGILANAYTSLDNTTYLALGDKHFKECLNLVLDFVQKPFFEDENVLIERKIIEEEVNASNENYYTLVENTLNKNLFKKLPLKYKITGDVEDLKEISAKDLDKAYKYFYNPENMFIVITGNFYPLEAIGIIKENQKNKKFLKPRKISIAKIKEPASVNKKNEIIIKNIKEPIINIGYKFTLASFKEVKEKDLPNLMEAFLFLTFGKSSNLNCYLLNENVITENIVYSYNISSNIVVINLLVRSKLISESINQIDKCIKKQRFNNSDLTRFKKYKIGSYISCFDDLISVNDLIVSDLINGKINTNVIDNINSLSVKSLNKLASFIKNDNKSVVIVKNNE